MLLRAAKARALVHGRDHALPDDVQALADAVLSHRLMLAPEAAGVAARGDRRATRSRAVPRAVGALAMRSRRSAAPRSGLLLLVVAGTFDAEPLYVTGAALLLLGAGAAAWIGLGGVRREARRARSASRSVVEDQPLQVKLQREGGAAAAAAGLDRRAAAARAACACPPGAGRRGCASRSRSAAAGAAGCRRPRSCCATRSGSPSA